MRFPPWRGLVIGLTAVVLTAEPIGPNDDAILQLARDVQADHPDLRAVIKADSAVTHGRVIHVLDLLKQAHVTKIAFGVAPAPAASH